VVNQKGQRCRGLWTKRGHFYAPVTANNDVKYRYPLDVQTIPDAVLAQQALKMKQNAGTLLSPGSQVSAKEAPSNKKEAQGGPNLGKLITSYKADRDALESKADGSCKRENSSLFLWEFLFGRNNAESIGAEHLSGFAKWRKRDH
jgi:hypothetical protein